MKKLAVSVVMHDNKLLILKRNQDKKFDPGKWEFVSSFIKGKDELKIQATNNVFHETSLKFPKKVIQGQTFEVEDKYGKWQITPFLFEYVSDFVKLTQDHSEYKWIDIKELKNFDCVNGLDKNLVCFGLI